MIASVIPERCDCHGCETRGQGTCGCFDCDECGLESLSILRHDEDSGCHYCGVCWTAKRRRQDAPEGALLTDGQRVRVMLGGRWLPLRKPARRTGVRKVA